MTYTPYYGNRKPIQLVLGREYLISDWRQKSIHVRFIQPTPKGFNFLDLETNKCILTPHLYPCKYRSDLEKNHLTFWVFRTMLIKSLDQETKQNAI